MDMTIKVSIVVAIYKSENFLNKLIQSIINQTYKNIEIILVDDGSPDNSGIICDQYKEKDDRIIVIHKQNGGACEARNVGMKLATGDYITIVDGDDWLEPDFVEYLVKLITDTGADIALTDRLFTTRDRVQTKKDKIEIWNPEKATAAIIYPLMEIGPWNKLYKTKLLRDNNITFSTKWSGEGLYFASRAVQFSNYVAVGHKKIYNYRLNNANSGLTHYNLQMGLNAYDNIRYIKENLVIKTKKTLAATNKHIWENYFFILFLIIATDSVSENRKKYKECKKEIKKQLIPVLIHSNLGIKSKINILMRGLFPVMCAKSKLKTDKKQLALDKME